MYRGRKSQNSYKTFQSSLLKEINTYIVTKKDTKACKIGKEKTEMKMLISCLNSNARSQQLSKSFEKYIK